MQHGLQKAVLELRIGEREHCQVLKAVWKCVVFLLNFITLGKQLYAPDTWHTTCLDFIVSVRCAIILAKSKEKGVNIGVW